MIAEPIALSSEPVPRIGKRVGVRLQIQPSTTSYMTTPSGAILGIFILGFFMKWVKGRAGVYRHADLPAADLPDPLERLRGDVWPGMGYRLPAGDAAVRSDPAVPAVGGVLSAKHGNVQTDGLLQRIWGRRELFQPLAKGGW